MVVGVVAVGRGGRGPRVSSGGRGTGMQGCRDVAFAVLVVVEAVIL